MKLSFKQWLYKENIEVPPHMPEIFWKDSLEKAKRLESKFISTNEMNNLERWLRDEEDWESQLDYDAHFISPILNDTGYKKKLSEKIESYLELLNWDSPRIEYIRESLENLDFYKDDLFAARHKDYVAAYTNFFRTKDRRPNIDSEADINEMSEEGKEKVKKLISFYHALMEYVKLIRKVSRKSRAILDVLNRRTSGHYNRKKGRIENDSTEAPSRDDIRDIEILYHATPFTREILSQGYKTKEELGNINMLGGPTEGGISFTADIEIAREIARCLREVIMIARGEIKMQDVIKMIKKDRNNAFLSSDKLKMWPLKDFILNAQNNKRSREFSRDNPDLAASLAKLRSSGDTNVFTLAGSLKDLYTPDQVFEMYKSYLGYTKMRYNPVFFGADINSFKMLDISNVGVLASKVDMNKAVKYLQSMEEYRVLTSGIYRTWKVKG